MQGTHIPLFLLSSQVVLDAGLGEILKSVRCIFLVFFLPYSTMSRTSWDFKNVHILAYK